MNYQSSRHQERVARMNARNQLKRARKSWGRWLAAGAVMLGFIMILGLVGHMDAQNQLESATANTCTQSAHRLNRWGDQCQALIKQVQTAYPNDEVLSDASGNYWIETKAGK